MTNYKQTSTPPTHQEDTLGSNFATTSATLVDVTGISITLPNNSGYSLITANLTHACTTVENLCFSFYDGSAVQTYYATHPDSSYYHNTFTHIAQNNGQEIKIQVARGGASGTLTIYDALSKVETLEFS